MILTIKEKSQRLFIPFEAEYQAVNACIAYQAARLLAVDGETAAAGIRNAVWRGRMEEIQDEMCIRDRYGIYQRSFRYGKVPEFVKSTFGLTPELMRLNRVFAY